MEGSKGAINKEECQGCGCVKMINNHYLRDDDHDLVFVECSRCGALVARYVIEACTNPALSCERLLKLVERENDGGGRKAMEEFQKHLGRGRPPFEPVKAPIKGKEEEPVPQLYFRRDIIEDD